MDHMSCHHSICGTSDAEILEASSVVNIYMNCPEVKVAGLIGRKGKVIGIMRRTLCKIFIEQNFQSNRPRQIQMSGDARSVGLAIALVTSAMALQSCAGRKTTFKVAFR